MIFCSYFDIAVLNTISLPYNYLLQPKLISRPLVVQWLKQLLVQHYSSYCRPLWKSANKKYDCTRIKNLSELISLQLQNILHILFITCKFAWRCKLKFVKSSLYFKINRFYLQMTVNHNCITNVQHLYIQMQTLYLVGDFGSIQQYTNRRH